MYPDGNHSSSHLLSLTTAGYAEVLALVKRSLQMLKCTAHVTPTQCLLLWKTAGVDIGLPVLQKKILLFPNTIEHILT